MMKVSDARDEFGDDLDFSVTGGLSAERFDVLCSTSFAAIPIDRAVVGLSFSPASVPFDHDATENGCDSQNRVKVGE